MTQTEAAGIVTRIGRYYPNWLKNMDEDEIRGVMLAWSDELKSLGSLGEVWPMVVECLRSSPSPFPPGIFEIRAYVSRRLSHLRSHHRALPQPVLTDEERLGNLRKLSELKEMLLKGKEAR